ncbi:MAG TPA: SapC family protein, partial [Sphingomicrobium sp.]|nr:SapC family protein [Sphingomicrobium sp.]
MTRHVSLREISHLCLAMPKDDCWVEKLNWIPVSASEYHLACRYFPFAMRLEDQHPELGLLVHPRYINNPLLDASGKWRGVYRPIGLRCFPFEAGRITDDPLSDITIAADSTYLSPSDGIPLIGEGGQPGKLVTELHGLLGLLQQSREIFADALDQYLVAGLLVELTDDANTAGPPLYVIDQGRLAQMSHAALRAMARHRFL